MTPEDAAQISQIVNSAIAPVIAKQSESATLLGRYDERLHAYTEQIAQFRQDNITQWTRIDETRDRVTKLESLPPRVDKIETDAQNVEKEVHAIWRKALGVAVTSMGTLLAALWAVVPHGGPKG